jgi:hypothetical protein
MRRDFLELERMPAMRNPCQVENPGASARGCYAEILGEHRGLPYNGEALLSIEML